MKKYLLIMLLFCTQVLTAQQPELYCRQYTLTDTDSTVVFGPQVCYVSEVTIIIKSDKEFTVVTDSLSLRFVILYRQDDARASSRLLASLVGQPGQVYSINRRTDDAGRFFLACKPVRFNSRFGKIQGIALEISNVDICEH